MTTDLTEALLAAALPVAGVALLAADRTAEDGWHVVTRPDGARVRVDYAGTPTQVQRDAAAALVLAFDPGEAAAAARDLARRRAKAKAAIRAADPDALRLRVQAMLTLRAIKGLCDYAELLRAEVVKLGGTLPAAPVARTYAQLEQAADAVIDAGQADPV
jgi:hypothetical protein